MFLDDDHVTTGVTILKYAGTKVDEGKSTHVPKVITSLNVLTMFLLDLTSTEVDGPYLNFRKD